MIEDTVLKRKNLIHEKKVAEIKEGRKLKLGESGRNSAGRTMTVKDAETNSSTIHSEEQMRE